MIRRWLPGMLLLALTAASGWLYQALQREPGAIERADRHDPDFFMTNFVTRVMDKTGSLERELSADRLDHYPDTDTNELLAPSMKLYRGPEVAWQVVSERGWVSADQDVVLLQGQVTIWQDGENGERRLEIITRDMRVLPESEYAETDQAALIRTPRGETRGVGMRAYLDRGRLELLSQVRTTYDQKTHH